MSSCFCFVFFLAQAKIHCNNSSHNCCNNCVGVTCTWGVAQIQADIPYKHKQADSKHTYKHMKAQTSRQQADIQTHESTWVVQIQAGIQYKHKQADSKHMKAQTSRQQADIQDTRRQHQTHECIGTRQTHKTQDTSTSTIMSHT